MMLEARTILQAAFVSALLVVPATCDKCGHTLNATYSWQTLTYPNIAVNYASNQFCIWEIKSRTGYIKVQSVYVHIQKSLSCSQDYIGIDTQRVCGEQSLRYLSPVEGRSVYLRFVSDGRGSDKGFSLMYRTVGQPGAIDTASPAMYSAAPDSTLQFLWPTWDFTPVTYRSGQDTTGRSFEKSWIIDTGNKQLSALVRFVESTIHCPNDFIKIFDGISTSSSVLGNLCDTGTKTFQSTGETLRVLFHSEGAAPGTIKFKYRAAVPTRTSSAVKIGLLVGGSFGVIICFAYLGFFIFCLYRKRKGEKDLINTPIICDSSASGGRDNDGYEDVFLHADMTEESGDIQLRSGPRGGNSRRGDHDTEHMGRPVLNSTAYQAGERNEKEDELRHGDKPIHIHENNQRIERHLDHGNRSRPDHPGAERSDGPQDDHDMHQARGRKTRGDWPGRDDRGTRGGRSDHVVGRRGGAREAYSEGQRDVTTESNYSRISADVEINDMEPVIQGGKLILRQSSMEGDII